MLSRRTQGITLAAVLTLSGALAATKTAIPPPPNAWVTDDASFLSTSAVQRFDARLRTYEQRTGHQLIVWIGTTLGDEPIEDWAATTFKAWRIGRKRLDDGLAIFIFAQDRKIRIEVGYGLEGVVPDAQAGRVIAQMVQRIRSGDRDGAVGGAITALTTMIGGADADDLGPNDRGVRRGQPQKQMSPIQAIALGIIGILVLLFLITHPRLALLLLMSAGRRGGGGWGGGGGGGGGFSGGGGSSGGGGASGSW